MSQITRCPACETQFKVASDQLRISEGWVRCGQCDEIFDAVAHLVPLDSFPVLSQVVPVQRRESPQSPPLQPAPVPAPELWVEPSSQPREPISLPEPVPAEERPSSALSDELSSVDDFAAQLRQALDFPPSRPVAPSPEPENLDFPEFAPAPEEPQDEEPAIELDFPSFAPADDPTEEAPAWPVESPFEVTSAPEADVQDNAVDPGLLGAKLSFPDDARVPSAADEADLLSERMAAEMDEVVLHLHESAEEPPVPDWMARTSATGEAPAPMSPQQVEAATPPLTESSAADASALGGLPPMAMPPLEADSDSLAPEPLPPMDLEPETLSAPGEAAWGPAGAAAAAAAATAATAGQTAAISVPSRWDHPAVRVALGVASLVLTLGLLVQGAVQWREPLLRWSGNALQGLQALCAPFQCTLAPPRQIADLVIDASGFRHLQDDRYELTMTLHNRAKTPLSMPALELTLTDAQDQALVRRVLQPADLAAPVELPPGERWETRLTLMLAAPDLSVASYRLLAFYP